MKETMKNLLRRAFTFLVGLLGERLVARIFHETVRAIAAEDPRSALIRFFAFAGEIDNAIALTAVDYGEGVHPKHRLMDYHRYFVERVRDGDRVLDVGCGVGAVAASLVAGADVTVLGLDDDPAHIDTARARHPHDRLEFRLGRAPLDLGPETFDVAVLSNVLEHVEDRVGLLRWIHEDNGIERVLIRLPLFDRHWTIPLKKELGLDYFCDSTHHAELTAEGWFAEIRSAGLIVASHEVHFGEVWLEARKEGA